MQYQGSYKLSSFTLGLCLKKYNVSDRSRQFVPIPKWGKTKTCAPERCSPSDNSLLFFFFQFFFPHKSQHCRYVAGKGKKCTSPPRGRRQREREREREREGDSEMDVIFWQGERKGGQRGEEEYEKCSSCPLYRNANRCSRHCVRRRALLRGGMGGREVNAPAIKTLCSLPCPFPFLFFSLSCSRITVAFYAHMAARSRLVRSSSSSFARLRTYVDLISSFSAPCILYPSAPHSVVLSYDAAFTILSFSTFGVRRPKRSCCGTLDPRACVRVWQSFAFRAGGWVGEGGRVRRLPSAISSCYAKQPSLLLLPHF